MATVSSEEEEKADRNCSAFIGKGWTGCRGEGRQQAKLAKVRNRQELNTRGPVFSPWHIRGPVFCYNHQHIKWSSLFVTVVHTCEAEKDTEFRASLGYIQ